MKQIEKKKITIITVVKNAEDKLEDWKMSNQLNIVIHIDDTFNGIAFCSVQYLKIQYNKKKDNLLMFDLLIRSEADTGLKDYEGNTVIDVAKRKKSKKIMSYLAKMAS